MFSCCIRFRSLATILLFLGLGGGTNNVAYSWGLLYIFAATRYFYEQKRFGNLVVPEMDEETEDSEDVENTLLPSPDAKKDDRNGLTS